ncbi:hypothetical protein C8R44DRAFT_888571 [Mycena epipterygia]|nr:hypothetical protein C8R44DRAFT_888571 [Mycena epipterygia]
MSDSYKALCGLILLATKKLGLWFLFFFPAIYASSALLLAFLAAPRRAERGQRSVNRETFNRDTVQARTGGDIFAGLDLTAREEVDVEVRNTIGNEPAGTPGCVVACGALCIWRELVPEC